MRHKWNLFLEFYKFGSKFVNAYGAHILLIVLHPVVFGEVYILKGLTILGRLHFPSGAWGELDRFHAAAFKDNNGLKASGIICCIGSWNVETM